MLQTVPDTAARFAAGVDLNEALERALDIVRPLGFTSVLYDYAPVPLTHDGKLILPSVLRMLNVPPDMEPLWRGGGYHGCDPVQDAALTVSQPFLWSYLGEQNPVMERVLDDRHAPVVAYLRDTRLTCGVTVPIRLAGGDLATFTVIRVDPERSFVEEAMRALPQIGLLGHVLHDAVYAGFGPEVRTCRYVRLTPRERQCLRLCADGLTAKEIAHRLGRSVPTVTLHLNSATRKLGARNRFQAIARAAHYRVLTDA